MKDDKLNVIKPGNLATDTSLVEQPQGSVRFALNAVNESNEGDRGNKMNEESNEACYQLPANTTPLNPRGLYIGNGDTLLFLVSNIGDSLIGIADKECNFNVIFTDANQDAKLGFKTNQQIDALFRLRRGCERTIYWIDPKPRIFIIDKPQNFQDSVTGDWDISKFSLFKKYSKIPNFQEIEVLNTGGSLQPGSYNISVQYLDEDLNPTEFTTASQIINIYNSSFKLDYKDVRGSTSRQNEYQNFGPTDKSIKITLSNLDLSFPFYRLAIIEATNGTGEVNDTKYTGEISTSNPIFTYTGTNFESIGTQEEVILFNAIIDKAGSIEQIENTLILGDIQGKDVNLCKLQKYASRITADMITKRISLTSIVEGNSKHPTVDIDNTGYMPGEIYSFGIVYIFDDNTLSPAYHIPGKNPLVAPNTVFNYGENVYPMDNTNNISSDTRYTENDTCDDTNYWEVDSEGFALKDTLVRHHRFPLRTDFDLPLIEKIDTTTVSNLYRTIRVFATGSIDVPVICAPVGDPLYNPACVPTSEPAFQFRVSYNADGNTDYYIDTIDPQTWGGESPTSVTINSISNILTANILSFIQIEEEGVLLTGTTTGGVFTSDPSPKGLTYVVSIVESLEEYKNEQYESQIMGIQFSNIQLPLPSDTNGEKIIGYYIVRNERIENEKTVLDSAVLGSTLKNKYFISHGHLMPELSNDTRVQKKIVSMINPEFKFNGRKYADFKIIQQGSFRRTEAIHSRQKVNDVLDGTSYNSSRHKSGRSDADGWTLGIKTRDNVTSFTNRTTLNVEEDRIKEVLYLAALEDRFITDEDNNNIDVFNLACDNRIGIISLKDDINVPVVNSVPYVYLYKDIANPYNNFRTTPYYKDTNNANYFGNDTISEAIVFGGDSYITPIRYTNSIFYDNRVKLREGKTSVWNYIIGAVLIILAVVLAYFTGGVSLGLIGAAGLIMGGASLIASGIKQDAWNRAYNDLYNKGLRETIADNYVVADGDCSSINNDDCKGFAKNPEDDEIQWLGETINLWFESAINMNLRQGTSYSIAPDFLNAPGNRELGTTVAEFDDEFFGSHSIGTSYIAPTTSLDYHMLKKLTYFDFNRKQSRAYIGLALAEIYEINPDYLRINKQKIFNHLGLEYDCCSDCNEKFPHRAHHSLQSFQEELTDNFRQFLPNNYRDLEGDTGRITDIFRIKNSLYIHTEEALWHLPQNYQERVTGEIVSFIGTGEFFATPPRKIVDDNNSSAGNTHKWGRLKSKYGILFPCHKESKWYMFDGEKLEPISDNYMTSEFKQRMRFLIEERYYSNNGFKNYPFRDNPSNIIGTGYISTYDTRKERFIVTKKDFDLTDLPSNDDFEICSEYGEPIIFNNISDIIAAQALLGFTYVGIEDCRMKFQKTTYVETEEIRTVLQNNPINRNIYVFSDTSGSFDAPDIDNIEFAVQEWYDELVANGYTGTINFIDDASEHWLNLPRLVSLLGEIGDVLILSFTNEAHNDYHGTILSGTVAAPTGMYIADYNVFLTTHPTFNSFRAINYPIITSGVYLSEAKVFLQHALAAIKGYDYETEDLDELEYNTAYSVPEWNTLKTSLQDNPYKTVVDGSGDAGLEKYGWKFKSNRNDLGTVTNEDCPGSPDIISPCQFKADINELLYELVPVEITVTISTPVIEYAYVDGVPLFSVVTADPLNNSWTLSYGLRDKQWISYHSYMPSFYMYVQERFYAWKHGLDTIFRFNRLNHYQTFFNEFYPFIVEYVDSSQPLINKVTESIKFQTEAKRFDTDTQEYNDIRNITFNKILVYNSQQISDILTMLVKNEDTRFYIESQVDNDTNTITIDRNERDWSVNELRDVSITTAESMFIKNLINLQPNYFIDKIVNPARIDLNKNWMEMESFRDKFLVVRLIFDTFDNTRLIMNFSIQDTENSER